jgi:hypothetical protein
MRVFGCNHREAGVRPSRFCCCCRCLSTTRAPVGPSRRPKPLASRVHGVERPPISRTRLDAGWRSRR